MAMGTEVRGIAERNHSRGEGRLDAVGQAFVEPVAKACGRKVNRITESLRYHVGQVQGQLRRHRTWIMATSRQEVAEEWQRMDRAIRGAFGGPGKLESRPEGKSFEDVGLRGE